MTSILFEQRPRPQGPDPIVVAFYSIIPGLGQIYNGKISKGILFLLASLLSLLMLLGSIFPKATLPIALFILSTLKTILGFFFVLDYKPSPAADLLMESIRFGGSFSTLLCLMILGFILYSMIDAYLDAERARQSNDQRLILTDSTNFRFSESAAGSYIIHSIAFILLFCLSLFLVIPTHKKEQITEIEFIMPQVESKQPPPPETKRRSTVQSVDQGKHDPQKPIAPAQKSQPVSQPPPMAAPQPPKPISPPRPVQPQPKPVVEPPMAIQPPMPKAAPKALPKISQNEGLTQAQPQPAPIRPSQSSSNIGSNNNNLPQPAAPDAPSNGGGSPGTVTGIAIIPKVPGFGGVGNAGNPPPNSRPGGPTSLAAKKDVDFGPYMNDLQRRIKRAWRPPRGNESKRVIVTFRVGVNGELSNLAIKVGSGFEPSDKAALLAVQAAAPFNRLPEGAPPGVDIEFTFDYNVFGDKGYYKQY